MDILSVKYSMHGDTWMTPSWDTGTVGKDNKILIYNFITEKEPELQENVEEFAVKHWCRSGL